MKKWEWNKSVLLKGDCMELMRQLPDGSVDMVLCDLPYGTTNCKWDKKLDLTKLWVEYMRLVKPNGSVVLTASQPFTYEVIASNPGDYKYEWIWVKNTCTGFQHAKNMPLKKHENVLVFSRAPMGHAQQCKGRRMMYNPQGLTRVNKICLNKPRNPDSIIPGRMSNMPQYTQEFSNYPTSILYFEKDGKLHPTQKPVPLFEYLIRTYTKSGAVVLDNCAGSGTTGIACLNTDRHFILMEKEQVYVDCARDRIGSHIKQLEKM